MGRKAGLSREEVLDAAAALADAEGLDGATLGATAQQLGIKTPSLYHYFEGAAGLRRALALRGAASLATELRRATSGHSGAAALRRLARAFRDFAGVHPGLYAALLPAPQPGEDAELYAALAGAAEVVAEALSHWQLPRRRVVPVIRALRSLLHGFVSLERDRGFGMPDDVDASFAAAVELFIAGLDAHCSESTGRPRRPSDPRRQEPP